LRGSGERKNKIKKKKRRKEGRKLIGPRQLPKKYAAIYFFLVVLVS
jgi:hypothetical protein